MDTENSSRSAFIGHQIHERETQNIISYESHLYKSDGSSKSDSQRLHFFVSGLLSGSAQLRNNADEPQGISRILPNICKFPIPQLI